MNAMAISLTYGAVVLGLATAMFSNGLVETILLFVITVPIIVYWIRKTEWRKIGLLKGFLLIMILMLMAVLLINSAINLI
ncbi:MAG: hypothetical protein Q7S64_00380 [bacterium]|nr:hypothetical protein [bacterium]